MSRPDRHHSLSHDLLDMLKHNWHLGITSFGGPAVHFQIFHRRFVERYKWIDEQTYQEMFALCQALPGPGSTKMIYCINTIHYSFPVGLCSFFVWSIPGAISAYALGIGISNLPGTLPAPVYALLSGLNAATVGIIALAAIQLSGKAITDKLTRILVFWGAAAGMLYNALWYFPLLMFVGGAVTVGWDLGWARKLWRGVRGKGRGREDVEDGKVGEGRRAGEEEKKVGVGGAAQENDGAVTGTAPSTTIQQPPETQDPPAESAPSGIEASRTVFSWKMGVIIITAFLVTFIIIMVLRGVLSTPPLGFKLFANLYLAGTIIFGGGPVVIPLLREYIVAENWVTPRDFLLGLAIIQAFPGPNFNFAVYLGTLTLTPPSPLGALLAYIAIFTPGLALHTGTMGLWRTLRKHKWFISLLRGVNASAVGLVFTAVYRLWEVGFLGGGGGVDGGGGGVGEGASLGMEPWWLVVAAGAFGGGMWFGVQAPWAILGGGVAGVVWWGVVGG